MESTSRNITQLRARTRLFTDILNYVSEMGQVEESWKVVDITGTRDRPVSLMFALGSFLEILNFKECCGRTPGKATLCEGQTYAA